MKIFSCKDVFAGNDYVLKEWKSYLNKENHYFLGVIKNSGDSGELIAVRLIYTIDDGTTAWFKALRVHPSSRGNINFQEPVFHVMSV